MHGLTVAGTLLEPRKLAVIVALAAEMLAGSNAEALVTDALTRATGLAIDAALFDFEAADEVRAAGLRHGIAASTASTATSADTAMIEDLATLAGQVAVVGGPITFVTSPARAVVISLLAHRELPFTVLGSPAVAADDLIAVATQCVVSARAPVLQKMCHLCPTPSRRSAGVGAQACSCSLPSVASDPYR